MFVPVRESSVGLCVTSRKTLFPVDWRLLVKEHIARRFLIFVVFNDILGFKILFVFLGLCKLAYRAHWGS